MPFIRTLKYDRLDWYEPILIFKYDFKSAKQALQDTNFLIQFSFSKSFEFK